MPNHDYKQDKPIPSDKWVMVAMIAVVGLSYLMNYLIDTLG